MTNTGDLRIQPDQVADASKQLDELVGRAEKLMQTEAPNLSVTPPSRDEVSQRVASTLNDLQADFRQVTNHGSAEIREIAATLRAHTDNIIAAEDGFAV